VTILAVCPVLSTADGGKRSRLVLFTPPTRRPMAAVIGPEHIPMMLNRPSFVMQVMLPMLAPIAASAGQRLVVWPGHPTHTVTVFGRDGRLLRHRYVADGSLYGPLLILSADGVLEPLTTADWQRLQSAG